MTDVLHQITETLSPEGLELFRRRLVTKYIDRHSAVIDKGDQVSGAYFVLEGSLRIFTLGANGREANLYSVESGETCVLALNAMFNGLLYPAWVEAETKTVLGILPGEVYRMLFAKEPAIQDVTVKALSSAVFGLMAAVETRETQSVEQRLANYLILKADRNLRVENTQQDIADRIGTTREVVGRYMADFARRGIVETSRGKVSILKLLDLKVLSIER